jgi:hypothetical protein
LLGADWRGEKNGRQRGDDCGANVHWATHSCGSFGESCFRLSATALQEAFPASWPKRPD